MDNKFDEWVYNALYESSQNVYMNKLRHIKTYYFYSYTNFCNTMKQFILDGDISDIDGQIFGEISWYAEKLYGLNEKESSKYLINFFLDDMWEYFNK